MLFFKHGDRNRCVSPIVPPLLPTIRQCYLTPNDETPIPDALNIISKLSRIRSTTNTSYEACKRVRKKFKYNVEVKSGTSLAYKKTCADPIDVAN